MLKRVEYFKETDIANDVANFTATYAQQLFVNINLNKDTFRHLKSKEIADSMPEYRALNRIGLLKGLSSTFNAGLKEVNWIEKARESFGLTKEDALRGEDMKLAKLPVNMDKPLSQAELMS